MMIVPPVRAALVLSCAWAFACHSSAAVSTDATSSTGTTAGSGTSDTGSAEQPACDVEAREPVRRLSAFEYTRALHDLLGVDIDEVGLPPSAVNTVFATEDAALGSSPVLVNGQFDATELAADAVRARLQAGETAAFLGCDPAEPACIDGWIRDFGKRAYRRPVADDERARLRALFDEVSAADGVEIAIAATVQALLLSPRFGFHVEEPGANGGPDDHAIASRLSFFLWASIPDDTLLAAADRGELGDPDQRAAQAQRLLADPRAIATVVRTWRELLDLDVLASVEPNDPRWTSSLRAQMDAEVEAFLGTTIFEHDGTLEAVLTSRWVDADAELASIYEVAAGPGELPPVRAGVLTRAAFLAATSHGNAPSPVRRGLVVGERLACTEIGPPPASVGQIPEPTAGVTNRARYEAHTADPACAGCHRQIDPIGFALEHFDAIGAYRTVDNGASIDASGSVLGIGIDGAADLANALAESDVAATCAVTQWLRYTLGHVVREGEACARDEIATRFIASGGDLQGLLVDVAASDLFVQ